MGVDYRKRVSDTSGLSPQYELSPNSLVFILFTLLLHTPSVLKQNALFSGMTSAKVVMSSWS